MSNLVSPEELLHQKEYMKKCEDILKNIFVSRQPICYVHSYGCQGNVADGEKIKGMLAHMGYGLGGSAEGADVVIFNTCAIRENAQDRVYGNLGMLIHYKKKNPNMIIGLCGCMVQQDHVAKKIKDVFPGVNLVFGTHVIHKLPEYMYNILSSSKKVYDIIDSDGVIVEGLPVVRESKIKASVPISYGCNNFCTYCIVPYVKGRERSRSFDSIYNEVKELVENGYKEVMLLGQNVNSYGNDLDSGVNFSYLLSKINEIDGDFRIRFMTSHPKDATKELIDTMANCDKVCKHLHLPLQCGSDRILKEMNRKYTVSQYLDIVDYAKSKISNISLTSDIIVGFPGETYLDFKETLKLIEKVEYSSLFMFIFSPRKGTKAELMLDPISREEKSKWFSELINCQNEISAKIHKNYVGRVERVLFDGVGRTNDNMLTGRTDTNLVVDCEKSNLKMGEFADVKIIKAHRMALVGELV